MPETAAPASYPRTPRTKVRVRKRAAYDRATVHRILDAGWVAHVAFVHDGAPVVIPIFYVRDGESVLIHGSRKTRMFKTLARGVPLALCVTHLDGLVLARSWFHHSMNYRSVAVHGSAQEVMEEPARLAALRLFMERTVPGRSDATRAPTAQEMKATMVLRIPLEECVAKVRTGGPNDDAADLDLPVWAGVVPLALTAAPPRACTLLDADLPVPEEVSALADGG